MSQTDDSHICASPSHHQERVVSDDVLLAAWLELHEGDENMIMMATKCHLREKYSSPWRRMKMPLMEDLMRQRRLSPFVARRSLILNLLRICKLLLCNCANITFNKAPGAVSTFKDLG
jgi:hypothetical protein